MFVFFNFVLNFLSFLKDCCVSEIVGNIRVDFLLFSVKKRFVISLNVVLLIFVGVIRVKFFESKNCFVYVFWYFVNGF